MIYRIHDELQSKGHYVKKGDEIGLFQFGGSSILVVFEEGHIKFDEDFESLSHQQIMVDVEVGKWEKLAGPLDPLHTRYRVP